MEEEKVRVKLHKELLESERQELKAQRRRKLLIALLCFLFLILGLIGGYAVAGIDRGSNVALFKTNKFDKILSYYKNVWLYRDNYEDLEETMQDKAFYGMSNFAEDKYSTYMSKSEIESFSNNINMNYVGIGAQYIYSNDIATITKVFKDSPAEKGGLLAGDILIKVEGQSVEGLSSDDIKNKITGVEGTNVSVTVIRTGKELELTFTRGAIEYTAYGEDKEDYIYLNIMSFGETTADECINYLDSYKNYDKIIIDLRDNSGGYQDSVQQVAGLFVGKDKIVLKETFNTGETKAYGSIVKKHYDNFKKIVLLVNENTASAAEVFTICLKETLADVTIVGTKTYGKGVVQSSYILEDGSAVKITSSFWSSPNGVSINGEGIYPDIEVKLDDVLYENVYNFEGDEKYKLDSVSNYVRIGEMALKYLKYDVKRTDGYFDASFENALLKFQEDKGLTVSGELDNDSYEAIISEVIREVNTNPAMDSQLVKAVEIIGE